MFFLLSKIFWFLAVPSTALALVALAGALLAAAARFRAAGLWLASSAAGLLLILGLGPVGTWLLLPLEDRFPAFDASGVPVAGIVVLGGAVEGDTSVARGQLSVGEAAERVIAMADLARRHPEARIVFSGGAGELGDPVMEADAIAQYGGELGLDLARVTFERTSRTTWENARNTRALFPEAPAGRWLLVTSARHMPRAIGCFRQVGFPITAYPVDYETVGRRDPWQSEPTLARGMKRLDDAVKEWIGLVAYRASGRTDALFPAPP